VAQVLVNPPLEGYSLTMRPRQWATLAGHLFSDGREHGAVILADAVAGPRGIRLLAREVLLARDGVDYVPGEHGHRALTATFVRDAVLQARARGLAYIAVHNHDSKYRVGFSRTDLQSHQRGYPALRQLTGQIVGGLVCTPYAAAGDLWLTDGTRADLSELVIPGNNLRRLRPTPSRVSTADARYDRQARLFGDRGQQTFAKMRVAIVGLGGIGSIINELLARLGVGALVLIDSETVEETNRPRLLACEADDKGRAKVVIAARNARRANPNINLELVMSRVEEPRARDALAGCDWIFLAADTASARYWVNATVQQLLIPGTQAGVKIPVDYDGNVGRIHAATRLLTPGEGCMWCNGLIDPTELAIEMQPDRERKQARYLDEVPAPSVIALNALAASEAVNHFMLAAVSLHDENEDAPDVVHFPRQRQRILQNHRRDNECEWCGYG
jgi:molybdopterin/thiamine biosynthesis adenylyltransferase